MNPRAFAAALLPILLLVGGDGRAEKVDLRQMLSKGINFDHIFRPYRDPRRPFTEEELRRMTQALRHEEIELVARLGFTHIRLNIGSVFLQEHEPPCKFRPKGFALLEKALDMAAAANIGVVLDMHQIPVPDLAGSAPARKAFTQLWEEIARKCRPRRQRLIYEILNEPRVEDPDAWREILMQLIAAVRRIDPNRTIMVTGGKWGGIEDLLALGKLPADNLVYSFHFYDPFVFTHQGASWSDPVLTRLKGIRYPLDMEQIRTAREAAVRDAMETWPFDAWPKGCGKAELAKTLEPAVKFMEANKVSLYCGEFGTHKPHAPRADRARWTEDVRSLLEEMGIGWGMWAYHSGFDLVEKDGTPTPEIVRALGLTGK